MIAAALLPQLWPDLGNYRCAVAECQDEHVDPHVWLTRAFEPIAQGWPIFKSMLSWPGTSKPELPQLRAYGAHATGLSLDQLVDLAR